MKFRIRHADKIVGLLAVVALLFLILVILLLGGRQNWFDKKYYYVAVMESASGVGENMPVLYKGFSIGNVDSVRLDNNDMVEVKFHVMEDYHDRVRHGSLVEVRVSPVGLGNQFFFYPGTGDILEEGAFIPALGSDEARQFIVLGINKAPRGDDSISSLIVKVNATLDYAITVLHKVDDAIVGTDATSMGRAIGKMETTLSDISHTTLNLDSSMEAVLADAKSVMGDAKRVLSGMEAITAEMQNPDGALLSILDTDGVIYSDLERILSSLAATLSNMEKATDYLPVQAPNISGLIEELRGTVKNAEDVLESMKNNPLLKKGIPEKVGTGSGGTSPRNLDF